MRISELILENNQLDELSASGVGQGIGKFAGNVARGTSDFFSGIKQGYQTARAATPSTAPATSATTPATGGTAPATSATTPATGGTAPATSATTPATGGTAPATSATTPATGGLTVGQINKAIPALRTRDLQSVKKTIDATIASKSSTPSATPATSGALGQMANQLSTSGPSSTGGQTTATPTGVRHTASATNPNQPTPESKSVNFQSKFLGMAI